MESWALISHGVSAYTKERLFLMSDPYEVNACKTCGIIGTSDKVCYACKKDTIAKIEIPYACKLLSQELGAMGIKLKFNLK